MTPPLSGGGELVRAMQEAKGATAWQFLSCGCAIHCNLHRQAARMRELLERQVNHGQVYFCKCVVCADTRALLAEIATGTQ